MERHILIIALLTSQTLLASLYQAPPFRDTKIFKYKYKYLHRPRYQFFHSVTPEIPALYLTYVLLPSIRL